MSKVALAEILLSMYPILAKTVKLNTLTQVLVRGTVFTIIGMLFSKLSFGEILQTPKYSIISLTHIIHIIASYLAFQRLNVGVAMAIFYMYPLVNLWLVNLVENEKINRSTIPYFILSILGVAIICYPSIKTKKTGIFLGILAIIVSVLTESITYVFYKNTNDPNPFNGVITLYLFGTILMLLFAPIYLDNTISFDWIKLILFNGIIGIAGYLLRFYSIPRVEANLYSINLFIGVISAYIFGWYFVGEKVTIYHIIGTAMIIYSIYGIYNVSKNT